MRPENCRPAHASAYLSAIKSRKVLCSHKRKLCLERHIVKCTNEVTPLPDSQGVSTSTLQFPEHVRTDQGIDSENKDQVGH
ncbi:hypothetical protein DPMN_115730 [Dreissena polymorpha]|uniref:Uncharacterized protein n=1 Tax=Dreissena polymorpha TaxID=45954 RepID=A0A9D4QSW7_DREPO|nr:hypothetical protein DPMN_115730 [Dreissena polymorpha]